MRRKFKLRPNLIKFQQKNSDNLESSRILEESKMEEDIYDCDLGIGATNFFESIPDSDMKAYYNSLKNLEKSHFKDLSELDLKISSDLERSAPICNLNDSDETEVEYEPKVEEVNDNCKSPIKSLEDFCVLPAGDNNSLEKKTNTENNPSLEKVENKGNSSFENTSKSPQKSLNDWSVVERKKRRISKEIETENDPNSMGYIFYLKIAARCRHDFAYG